MPLRVHRIRHVEPVCRVNGEVRQDASTQQMIFKIPELIANISRAMTLYPGDVMSTGSPSGCGFADGRYLRSGDVVKCEIEKIGKLSNPVVLRD
jgi:2-keto-4-pentenoate hydratase/2-oxohepta-3-ene-1,7-dioic acid hydratase in catechol pathway